MSAVLPQDTMRRLVGLNYVEWLGEPGEYVLRETVNSADRARMARLAKRAGCVFRSSRDHSGLLIDIRRGA